MLADCATMRAHDLLGKVAALSRWACGLRAARVRDGYAAMGNGDPQTQARFSVLDVSHEPQRSADQRFAGQARSGPLYSAMSAKALCGRVGCASLTNRHFSAYPTFWPELELRDALRCLFQYAEPDFRVPRGDHCSVPICPESGSSDGRVEGARSLTEVN